MQREIIVNTQRELCEAHGAEFAGVILEDKLGISTLATQGVLPINGLRHPPESGTSCWHIWSGEYSEHEDFFLPRHFAHLVSEGAGILSYLGIAPGWRFLIGVGGYKDVWFDPDLIAPNHPATATH